MKRIGVTGTEESQGRDMARFDAEGGLTAGKIAALREAFEKQGAVHAVNTGLAGKEDLLPLMSGLGFGEKERFSAGGRTASSWQEKWAAPGLRRMDYYPPHLYLLPNNEIQYRRDFPARVLFFCGQPAERGGRTFLHSAKGVERRISAGGPLGRALLDKIAAHGLTIETGFVDENHPRKAENYHQSWQERFGTKDKGAALETARALNREYDACWWKEYEGHSILMTRITLPGFIADRRDGVSYLRFPRIAMDGPAFRNGFRRFPLGNGQELTGGEKNLLLAAYRETREGLPWKRGDLILMDNIRYGHSREPFQGEREVFLGMAGLERIETTCKEFA